MTATVNSSGGRVLSVGDAKFDILETRRNPDGDEIHLIKDNSGRFKWVDNDSGMIHTKDRKVFRTTAERLKGVASAGLKDALSVTLPIPGLPLAVDATNELLNLGRRAFDLPQDHRPFLGTRHVRENIAGDLERLGLPEDVRPEPGNFTENAALLGASAAIPSLGVFAAGKYLPKAPPSTKTKFTGPEMRIPEFVHDIAKNPKTYAATEALAATGGATGKTLAEHAFPDSPVASIVGELLGYPGGGMLMQALPYGVQAGKQAWRNFWPGAGISAEEAAMNRAGSVVQTGIKPGAADEVLRRLNEADEKGTIMSGADIAGETALLKIAEDIAPPEVKARVFEESTRHITGELEKSISSPVSGETFKAHARRVLAEEAEHSNALKKAAIEKAKADMEAIPNLDKKTQATIVRENLEKAEIEARKRENEAWRRITDPKNDTPITDLSQVSNTERALAMAMDEAEHARTVGLDMVNHIKRFLYEPGDFMAGDMADKVINKKLTLRTLQNIRSTLLTEARLAASQGNTNRSSLLHDMQRAVLNDMLDVPGVGKDLETARTISRINNENFRQGPVGDVLRTTRTGAARVDPEMTLQKLIATSERGGVNIRDLLKADSSPATVKAVEDYLAAVFIEKSTVGAALDVGKAKAFLEKYKYSLERLPNLRVKISQAIDSGSARDLMVAKQKSINSALTKNSAAQFVQNDDLVRTMRRIRESSASPAEELTNLVNLANKDPSGEALEGLRRIMFEDIIDSVRGDRLMGEHGTRPISRSSAQKLFRPSFSAALKKSGLYTDEQLQGVDLFMEQLDRLYKKHDLNLPATSLTAQELRAANEMAQRVATIATLRVLPVTGVTKAGGGSIAIAQRISKFVDKMVGKIGVKGAQDMLVNALTGTSKEHHDLLRALMHRVITKQDEIKVVKAINAYLLTLPQRYQVEPEEEENGSQ